MSDGAVPRVFGLIVCDVHMTAQQLVVVFRRLHIPIDLEKILLSVVVFAHRAVFVRIFTHIPQFRFGYRETVLVERKHRHPVGFLFTGRRIEDCAGRIEHVEFQIDREAVIFQRIDETVGVYLVFTQRNLVERGRNEPEVVRFVLRDVKVA